jgi:hypothetical protein
MSRDDRGWSGVDGDTGNRSDARLSNWARQPFNRSDRSIYDPLPRDNGNRNPRPQNRQYNRYFPRSAKR